MPTISLLLNILWFILGGFISGLAWLFAAFLMAITVIGLPYAQAAVRIALFSFAPFGRHVVPRQNITGHDLGTGPLGLVLNIIWVVLAGWWLALHHVVIAAAQAVTIIGLPFAWQHLKLAFISFAPIGQTVVDAPA